MHHKSTLAVLAVTALAAGCGSGGDKTLTKSEVIAKGSAICKAAEKRVEGLPQLTVEHPFAKGMPASVQRKARQFLAGYADALEFSRAGLAKLKAPAQDRGLLDGYLGDTGKVVAQLRAAAKAPGASAEAKANSAFQMFETASGQTAKYGFPKGVCGAG